jgi:hypothetical protein
MDAKKTVRISTYIDLIPAKREDLIKPDNEPKKEVRVWMLKDGYMLDYRLGIDREFTREQLERGIAKEALYVESYRRQVWRKQGSDAERDRYD